MVNAQPAFAQIDNAIKFKVVAPDGWYDETIVRLHDSATVEFDGMLDAWKLFTPNNAIPSLYSFSSEQWEETINAIPFPVRDTSMGLMMRTIITGGIFTMEIEFQGTFEEGIRVGIEDLVTGDFYILNQDTSFFFPVLVNPNDYERFKIHFSPAPEVVVNGNDALLINNGGMNWISDLYQADDLLIYSDLVPADSIHYNSLVNGDYYIISTDSLGFMDTTLFTIDVSEEPLEEPSVSIVTHNNSCAPVIKTIGDNHLVCANFTAATDVHVFIYTVSGSLVNSDFISGTQALEYYLPQNGQAQDALIIIVIAGGSKFDFKVVY